MFSGLEALQSFFLAKNRQKVTLTQIFGENSLFFFTKPKFRPIFLNLGESVATVLSTGYTLQTVAN
jgi:hypothetical protein